MGNPHPETRTPQWCWRVSDYWRRELGKRIGRITVDGGFTCPNRDGRIGKEGCAWCNNLAFSPAVRRGGGREISWQVRSELIRAKMKRRYDGYLVFFQPYTNTYAPLDRLRYLYDQAWVGPEIVGIAVATRPDCVDEKVMELLAGYRRRGKVWLELGLQTSHDAVLARMGRHHAFDDFVNAVKLAHSFGVEVIVHLMLGLPGEGKEDNLATMRALAELPLNGIKFHHLQVLRHTRLEDWYSRGEFACDTMDEYVDKLVSCLELVHSQVVIHRLMSEVDGDYLVAPRWETSAGSLVTRLREMMKERGSYQGKRWTPSRG